MVIAYYTEIPLWSLTMILIEVYVNTSLGSIVGKRESNIHIFLGIPFAEPPLLNLRYIQPNLREK